MPDFQRLTKLIVKHALGQEPPAHSWPSQSDDRERGEIIPTSAGYQHDLRPPVFAWARLFSAPCSGASFLGFSWVLNTSFPSLTRPISATDSLAFEGPAVCYLITVRSAISSWPSG